MGLIPKPVLDRPTHEKTIGGGRYGCHNRPEFAAEYYAKSGYDWSGNRVQVWTLVPHRMSTECRYDQSLTDPMCSGCKHAGSGEQYAEGVRLNGA